MRFSTLVSLFVSLMLAAGAVFGVRAYLADQQIRLAALGKKSQEKTLIVAAKAMRFGDRVRAENLKVIPWLSNETPAGSFQTVEEVVGDDTEPRYVMAAIDPGEPVLTSKITGAGERATLSAALDQGMKAISIRVNDVLGVAGFVRPSDRVDVLLTRVTRNENNDEQTFVDVLLQGVKVLAVDQTADERKDEPSVVKTVTFEVTTDEAQRLTLGANIGTLSLALRNIASSSVENTRRLSIADLGGGPIAADLLKENLPEEASPEKQAQVDVRPAEAPPQSIWGVIGVWNTVERQEFKVLTEDRPAAFPLGQTASAKK